MKFTTAQVLSITTGRMFCESIDGVYEILNFMVAESLMTHQLPRAAKACKDSIIQQCPWSGIDGDPITSGTYESVLADIEAKAGKEHELTPLAAGEWDRKDPITEACDMRKS